MHFDSTKTPFLDRPANHLEDLTSVSRGVNKGKSDEAIWVARHQAGDIRIGSSVVGVKRREDNSFVDACSARATQVRIKRRVRIPRRRQQVTFPGMTVTIDNHEALLSPTCVPGARRPLRPMACKNQIDVSIPLK